MQGCKVQSNGSLVKLVRNVLGNAEIFIFMNRELQSNRGFSELQGSCFRSVQSQKTQGFCVADFATLSDERRSRLKLLPLFIWIKEPCVRKFEGLERSKLLGISQTKLLLLKQKAILGKNYVI